MKVSYRQEMNTNRLVLEEENACVPDYRFHMLLSHNIRALLPCSLQTVDTKICFSYDISGKESLAERIGKTGLSVPLLKKLMTALLTAEEICGEYLLSAENLFLRKKYIFLEEDRFFFCYLPTHKEDPGCGLHTVLEEMLPYASPQDTATVHLLYRLYNESGKGIQLRGFAEKWQQEEAAASLSREMPLDEDETALPPEIEEPEPAAETEACAAKKKRLLLPSLLALLLLLVVLLLDLGNTPFFRLFTGSVLVALFGMGLFIKLREKKDRLLRHQKSWLRLRRKEDEPEETTYEDDSPSASDGADFLDGPLSDPYPDFSDPYPDCGETTLLNMNTAASLILAALDGTEQFSIDSSPYLIGSKEGAVSGVILTPTVSRLHAKIEQAPDGWYLEDLSSTNGTFLNRKALTAGKKSKIADGDRITFANVPYRALIRFGTGT